jgi:hypothetical protein
MHEFCIHQHVEVVYGCVSVLDGSMQGPTAAVSWQQHRVVKRELGNGMDACVSMVVEWLRGCGGASRWYGQDNKEGKKSVQISFCLLQLSIWANF